MIKKIEDMTYYELLEVSPTANSTEIHRAYERVRRVYEPNSIALYSLLTPEETAVIHNRIEEAYRTLLYEANRKKYDAELRMKEQVAAGTGPLPPVIPQFHERTAQPALPLQSENRYLQSEPMREKQEEQPAASQQEDISPVSPFIAEFTGPVIRVLREQRKLTVKNIADTTKLGSRYIEAIEEELFNKLPARPYLRGFLVLYAKALGYEPERVVTDYLRRYDAAMNPAKK